jgi:hypothetical protein
MRQINVGKLTIFFLTNKKRRDGAVYTDTGYVDSKNNIIRADTKEYADKALSEICAQGFLNPQPGNEYILMSTVEKIEVYRQPWYVEVAW